MSEAATCILGMDVTEKSKEEAQDISWATTATGNGAASDDNDIQLGELEIDSDTDHPVAVVAARTSNEPEVTVASDNFFDFDDLPDMTSTSSATSDDVPEHFARKPKTDFGSKPVEVAMLINGSRGDVQPFVALAQELHRQGRRTIIFTNYDFLGFCESAGVEAVATFASWSDLFKELGGLSCPDVTGNKPLPTQQVLQFVTDSCNNKQAHVAARGWRAKNPNLITDPYDALVFHEPSMVLYCLQSQQAAVRYEDTHKAPAVPVYFTSAFGPHFTRHRPERPSLFAVSAALDVRPVAVEPQGKVLAATGSNNIHVTGPWLLDECVHPQDVSAIDGALHALQCFLEAGEKPVVFGWGSMVSQSFPTIDMLVLALKALKLIGKRGVILGGWAKLHALGREFVNGGIPELDDGCRADLRAFSEENVFFISCAPHSWLFPQCCCVVHHGGAGTAQVATNYGCPAVITPIYGDQFHFAQRIQKLGAGVGFQKSLNNIGHDELAKAIEKAMRLCAPSQLAKCMKKEQGTDAAVKVLRDFLDQKVHTNKFAEELDSQRAQERKKC